MKKPLLSLLCVMACSALPFLGGCAVGTDTETDETSDGFDQSGEEAVGSDHGLDAVSGDEIQATELQDGRATHGDQLDHNGIGNLTGEDEEGPDPTPWEDEEDKGEGSGHDGGEREGPDPTPWMKTTGPDPTPWQGSESDDDDSGGSGTWTTNEEEEPDPQPWSTRSANSGSSED